MTEHNSHQKNIEEDCIFEGLCNSCGCYGNLDPDAGWCESCCAEYAREQEDE